MISFIFEFIIMLNNNLEHISVEFSLLMIKFVMENFDEKIEIDALIELIKSLLVK